VSHNLLLLSGLDIFMTFQYLCLKRNALTICYIV